MKIEKTNGFITEIRKLLCNAGFYINTDNLIYDKELTHMVKAFQATHYYKDNEELETDGIVGDKTLWALKHSDYFPEYKVDYPQYLYSENEFNMLVAKEALNLWKMDLKEIPNGCNSSQKLYDLMWKYYKNIYRCTPKKGLAWCAAFAFRNIVKIVGKDSNVWTTPGKMTWNLAPRHTLLSGYGVYAWAKNQGFLYDIEKIRPEPGMLFIRSYSGGSGKHIGMVYAYDHNSKEIISIEGNVSNAVRMLERKLSDPKMKYLIKWY